MSSDVISGAGQDELDLPGQDANDDLIDDDAHFPWPPRRRGCSPGGPAWNSPEPKLATTNRTIRSNDLLDGPGPRFTAADPRLTVNPEARSSPPPSLRRPPSFCPGGAGRSDTPREWNSPGGILRALLPPSADRFPPREMAGDLWTNKVPGDPGAGFAAPGSRCRRERMPSRPGDQVGLGPSPADEPPNSSDRPCSSLHDHKQPGSPREAPSTCRQVEMVIVSDDIAIRAPRSRAGSPAPCSSTRSPPSRRGGKRYATVKRARKMPPGDPFPGVSLSACTIPGQEDGEPSQ